MNSRLLIALCFGLAFVACNKDQSSVATAPNPANSAMHYSQKTTDDSDWHSRFIPTDVANQMISSYIYSLSSGPSGSINDLKSLSINADSLRAYLSHVEIKNIKLILAHTMDYINAGNNGRYAGMQSGALTIIIAGYDSSGNYIFQDGANVLDHALPCPYSCPNGAAGNDLLQ